MTTTDFKNDFNDASKAAQIMGRIGGKSRSEAKKKSSRENGKLGGWHKNFPKGKTISKSSTSHGSSC